ncbi:tRNA (adenosine(37)-N6)-threonylcarbamoyltransferase complex dimerization subunit type 1 TsaB [Neisseriaceae bacterium TC5R-5]|nr:tRNA (adenosine(37)-N6)-threonylcarbamoyltransferase complex dimerization subunit type 1 TsaB [Neisseriaceae bacterium TC5R-5]
MKLLAIDTSTNYLSLALCDGEHTASFHEEVGQKHAERILPELAKLLQQCAISLANLDAIVFGQGPGSFTGLRIGCGVAQGLAFAAGCPLIAIPSLDNMAYQAEKGTVMVCLDARMQQVYSAIYQTDTRWQRISDIQVSAPESIVWSPHITVVAGDCLQQYPELLPPHHTKPTVQSIRPHALSHLELAKTGRYPQLPAHSAELLYIRDKIALTSQEQQQARQK